MALIPGGGFEPPTPCSTDRCSNLLSYPGKIASKLPFRRGKSIGYVLSTAAWELRLLRRTVVLQGNDKRSAPRPTFIISETPISAAAVATTLRAVARLTGLDHVSAAAVRAGNIVDVYLAKLLQRLVQAGIDIGGYTV